MRKTITRRSKQVSYLLPYTQDNIHPGFSVDCVLLCYHNKKLRVLLTKYRDLRRWQLPGGFMMKDENAEQAATRILYSRTGLSHIFLKQFHLFSDINRTNLEDNASITVDVNEDAWFVQRFISLAFYAFVKYEDVALYEDVDSVTRWFDVSKLPILYTDHNAIVAKAIEYIKLMTPILPVATELLPEKFVMSDLRRIFECIAGRKLDRRNFHKKVMSSGLIKQLDEVATASTYNPPILYSLNNEFSEHVFDLGKLWKVDVEHDVLTDDEDDDAVIEAETETTLEVVTESEAS